MQPLERDGWLCRLVRGLNLDLRRVLQQGADDQARAITQRVHAEQLVGRAVSGRNQAIQFVSV